MRSGKDIAAQTGFSLSTVMKVLGGNARKYNISAKTEKIIFSCAENMGYCRNDLAATIRTGISRNIGVIMDCSPRTKTSTLHFLAGILRAAADAGQGITLYTEEDIPLVFEHLRHNRISKLISSSIEKEQRELTARLARRSHIELVFIYETSLGGFPAVNANNFLGMKMAAEYMICLGHRRLLLTCGPARYDFCLQRKAGFLAALAEAGIPPKPGQVDLHDISDYGQYVDDLLALPEKKRPTAILSTTDTDLLYLLPCLRRKGIRVPEDISLFGFGNSEGGFFSDPPLSTVNEHLEKAGETTLNLLIGRETGLVPDSRGDYLILPELVLRSSACSPNRKEMP